MTADPQISEREREILRLVATGATNQQIAQQLNISINTVKVHLRNIFGKIGAASRTEATMYAVRSGIVALDQARAELAPVEPPVAVLDAPAEVVLPLPELRSEVLADAAALPAEPVPVALAPVDHAVPADPESARAAEPRATTQSRLPLLVVGAVAAVALIAVVVLLVQGRSAPPSTETPSIIGVVSRASWIRRPDLPVERAGSAVIANRGTLLLVGGESAEGVTGAVLQFDPDSQVWSPMADKPTPVTDIQAGVIGGELLVPGGRLADGTVSTGLEIFNLTSKTWRSAKAMPEPRSAYGLAVLDGKLYVLGGWDGQGFRNDVFMYDPTADAWTVRTAMPTARAYASAVATADGTIFVLGGENERGPLPTNEVYTPAQEGAGAWQIRASLPQPNSRFGSGEVAGFLYTFGGSAGTPYRYNIRAEAWEQLDPGEPPVNIGQRPAVAVLDDASLFIIGGEQQAIQRAVTEYRAIYVTNLPVISR
ncbi:MAG TPA: LuxR C-terminal-related transcriptional regulator [Roseiflexaceae bacterium]|nr:LuxR C-terminal-related transcriptional regulator [Roseiflexaceae bacterium]